MDAKDLIRALDLDGDPPDAAHLSPPPPSSHDTSAGLSPTALLADAWGLRRGRDLLAEGGRLAASKADEYAAADFFIAAFDPAPELLDACADPRRREFLSELLGSSGYASLHALTQLDDTASGIAAAHFAGQYAALKAEDSRKEGAAAAGASGVGNTLDAELAALRAAGRAVAGAGKEVGELVKAACAFGMGPGEPGSNDPTAIAALFKRVRSDPSLRRVCELAGRFRRVAQSRQRRKASHGLDEVVGIEPGGDVARLLPSELARLMFPELELDALRRIADREAVCREFAASEPVGKGPVIVSVDESGSMRGGKAEAAKALALALAWVARRQRRWCALVAYSGDSGERLLSLPPGRWDEGRLADWLTAFIGMGSTIDVPVREMPRMFAELGAPSGATDLVFVTDARCSLPPDVRDRFLAWKASSRARLTTLVLGGDPGDLALVSDACHRVADLDPGSDAVGAVLSL